MEHRFINMTLDQDRLKNSAYLQIGFFKSRCAACWSVPNVDSMSERCASHLRWGYFLVGLNYDSNAGIKVPTYWTQIIWGTVNMIRRRIARHFKRTEDLKKYQKYRQMKAEPPLFLKSDKKERSKCFRKTKQETFPQTRQKKFISATTLQMYLS